jgi:3-oxoacyl-(acyl-carrier-protein) synthase
VKSVVITGLGVIAPNGTSVEQFWDNVIAGRVVIEDDPLMTEIGLRCRGVARCRDFALDDHWAPDEARELAELGRFVQMGVTAGRMAVEDSCLASSGIDLSPGGVVFASAVGGAPEMQELYERLTDGGRPPILPRPVPASAYDGIFLDYVPARIARRYEMAGPTAALTTGCTAGVDAMGLGMDLVRHEGVPFAVVGASENPLNGISYATLDVIGCLSRADGPVERSSRPFDATRAGFVIAEGAAFLVVEDADHARARGARVYAEILGFASTSNAHHMTDLQADGDSMAVTIGRALADARVEPSSIEYVSAHGSSTPQNDLFETNAVKTIFGDLAPSIPMSSIKSMIGHSLSSASLMALIATVGAMRRSMVPPTANYEMPDPECDLDYVVSGARPKELTTALVIASGFGGIHSATVLRRVR